VLEGDGVFYHDDAVPGHRLHGRGEVVGPQRLVFLLFPIWTYAYHGPKLWASRIYYLQEI